MSAFEHIDWGKCLETASLSFPSKPRLLRSIQTWYLLQFRCIDSVLVSVLYAGSLLSLPPLSCRGGYELKRHPGNLRLKKLFLMLTTKASHIDAKLDPQLVRNIDFSSGCRYSLTAVPSVASAQQSRFYFNIITLCIPKQVTANRSKPISISL